METTLSSGKSPAMGTLAENKNLWQLLEFGVQGRGKISNFFAVVYKLLVNLAIFSQFKR